MLASLHLPAAAACLLLSILGAMRLGGGIYEMVVIDPAWPSKPALIQPPAGGIDRKRFWFAANSLFELTLVAAFVTGWHVPAVRSCLLAAAIPYAVMRGWSFAYFIPAAYHFERGTNDEPRFLRSALRWTFLSRFRAALDSLSLAGCLAATGAALGVG